MPKIQEIGLLIISFLIQKDKIQGGGRQPWPSKYIYIYKRVQEQKERFIDKLQELNSASD